MAQTQPRRLFHPGRWGLGATVLAVLCVLILVGAGAALLSWAIEGTPKRPPHPTVDDYLNVLKLLLAIIAGLGAAVGLVVTYRRQRTLEAQHERDRQEALTSRFAAASEQLGHEAAAVRLAGVSAMARLADEWEEQRQMCVDVLCAYLRMPYEPSDASAQEREVRLTSARAIAERLRSRKWEGLDFDLNGVVFDKAVSFEGAVFSSGTVLFGGAVFSGGAVFFMDAVFSGARVFFGGAMFHDAALLFEGAVFSGGKVSFDRAVFSGGPVSFERAVFSGGEVDFAGTAFSGAYVDFRSAEFAGGNVDFRGTEISGGFVQFVSAVFSGGEVSFDHAVFSGGDVAFVDAVFSGGEVSFYRAVFSGGTVLFPGAVFSGGQVDFWHAKFSGGKVDLSHVGDWSHPPTGLPDAAPGLLQPAQVDSPEPREEREPL
jgi:uncharacterized protein YjbI with pentapeptide repeats